MTYQFKKGQLVMKVKHPRWLCHFGGGPIVPLRSIGEVINPAASASCGCTGIGCYWPGIRQSFIMQKGTIIPLNDPDYKEDDEQCLEKVNTTERLPKVKITEGQS